MSKRGHEEAGSSTSGGPPSKKKLLTQFDPVKLGAVYSLEEMDMKVLQIQNRKLAERIVERRKAEEELRKRMEQLEQRQTTDDAVLNIVNRYWNQLDEDVRVLLQRFDAEGADESEMKNESSAVTSFLTLLSTLDTGEIGDKLCQRVEFSKRAIGKLLQAYDRLLQRNEKLHKSIKEKSKEKQAEKDEGSDKEEPAEREESINETLMSELTTFRTENKRLHEMTTNLHQRHHQLTLKNSEVEEKMTAAETEVAELKNKVDDLEYDLGAALAKVDKLDKHLAASTQKLSTIEEGTSIKVEGGRTIEGVSSNKEILAELEEQRELATTRLSELETLNKEHQDAKKTIEQLQMDLSTLPESVIVETTEYKCLQSQFSVLYNESMQMKTQLEETRQLLQTSKNAHLKQIEQMEQEELICQKKLRIEMIQLEDTLAQVRKEYEMLRIEFEQTLAANEQTGPINREMRHLISSLKNHNEQLKGEVARYRKRLKEGATEIAKLKAVINKDRDKDIKQEEPDIKEKEKEKIEIKEEKDSIASTSEIKKEKEHRVKIKEEIDRDENSHKEKGKPEPEVIRELKQQLKKAQDDAKAMKLLLDTYKSAQKDSRDKVQLMASEKRCRQEIEDLRGKVHRLQEAERRERRKLADEDAIRKIKRLEEIVGEQQKNISGHKQEEEALLKEMEVTGQAFEDMQEQNIRLLQQLREKDDANFKLMSERIKSNQIHKLLREEKDVICDQVGALREQCVAQNAVVRKLEEKERILQNNLATVEKELGLRQQAMELHKRKAIESSQTAADLKLHLDKYQAQLKEAQTVVAEKTSSLQHELHKHKRIQEEVASLRRKLERVKKIEQAGTADEVLMEEIREYKEQLTCPSCKVKKKDCVLTKCFHVFCLECIKTRYDTRQRKCPKCNQAFGAHDYHRLFLE